MKRLVILSILGITFAVLPAIAQNEKANKKTKDMHLIVVNSTGAEVGTLIDFQGQVPDTLTHGLAFAITNDGRIAPFGITPEGIDTEGRLYYQSTNCTGTPFILTNTPRTFLPRTALNPPGQTLYIEQVGAIHAARTFQSYRDLSGTCNPDTAIELSVPVTSTGLDFSIFVPPFTVELALRN